MYSKVNRSESRCASQFSKPLFLCAMLLFLFAPSTWATKPVGCTTNNDCNYQVLEANCLCTGEHCVWDGQQVDGHDFDMDDGPNHFCRVAELGSCSCVQCTSPTQICTNKNTTKGILSAINSNAADGLPVAEDFVNLFLSQIPEGGAVLSTFFTAFVEPAINPHSAKVWDQVKDKVKKVVNTKVADQEMETLQDNLEGIQSALNDYSTITDPNDKPGKIVSIQTQIEAESCGYINASKKYSKGGPLLLLPQMASLHLAIQFEVLKIKMEQNQLEILIGLINSYKSLAISRTEKAITWRMSKVHDRVSSEDDSTSDGYGGEYYYATDALNSAFGLKQYSCYQTQTSGSPPGSPDPQGATYACWPVCGVHPYAWTDLTCLLSEKSAPTDCNHLSDRNIIANTCLSDYRSDLKKQITDFWNTHLKDFATTWEHLRVEAYDWWKKHGTPLTSPIQPISVLTCLP